MGLVLIYRELGEIVKLRSENIKDNKNPNLLYVSTTNMNPNKTGIDITSNNSIDSSGKRFQEGDVLVSNIRPYFKKIWKADRDGFSSADVLNFIPRNDAEINKTFLFYLLSNDEFFAYMMATSKGTKMPRGDKEAIKKYRVPLFTIEEQNKIANLLSSLDDKIENNNAIIANLEEQAQMIFKSWFVDFEPFQDEEFIESELGEIPQSFKVQCISDFASISSGKRRKNADRTEQNKYPIVGATKVTGYTDEYLTEDKVIITGRVGTLGSFQLFKSKIWPSDNTLVLKSDMFGFAYFSLKQVNYKALNRGSTQPLVTQTDIKNSKVAMPDINLLNTFESLVDPMIEMYWKLSEQNKRLSEIRDTLLPKLMSGEIRVEEVDTVE